MRKVSIAYSTVIGALDRAHAVSDDWQAECLELLRIPALAKRWQELHPNMPGVRIDFHPGLPHKGMTPEDNRAVEDWSVYAGYIFVYGIEDCPGYGWNSVRSDYYGHSPGTCWDGVRRETIHSWIDCLRLIVKGYDHPSYRESLEEVGVCLAENKTELVGT